MDFLAAFTEFIQKIIELIKSLVAAVRDMNDGKLGGDEETTGADE